MSSPDPHRRTPGGWRALLLAGPLSFGAALLLLVAGQGWFEQGPGSPSAGRPEAWGLIWGVLLIVLLGHAISAVSAAALVALRFRRREPLPPAAWWSAGYHLFVAAPFFYLWFSR